MASTASSWLASLRSTPSTCRTDVSKKSGIKTLYGVLWTNQTPVYLLIKQKYYKYYNMLPHLYDPISSLQSPVLSSRAVVKDVLDENAPHHLPIAQPAAHPSAPDDADAQRLARLSEELHPETETNISHLDSLTAPVLMFLHSKSILILIVCWTDNCVHFVWQA